MDKKGIEKYLDYFPVAAYFGFWLQGCLFASFMTGSPALVKLGIVTAPAMIAMVAAIIKIRNKKRGG